MDTKKVRWSRVFSALPKQDWLVIGWTIWLGTAVWLAVLAF